MHQKERTRFRGVSIGFVFQFFNLLPALNAVENVSVPLLINGESRKKAETRASETLLEVDLGTRLSALPAQLSGGQQQRVAEPLRTCRPGPVRLSRLRADRTGRREVRK
jgi:putative ABC transport system ATP-binding protein